MQPKLVGGNYFTIIEQDLDPDQDQNDVMEYDPVKKDWSPTKRLIAVWDDREIKMFVQIQPGAIAPVIENPSTDMEEVDDDAA